MRGLHERGFIAGSQSLCVSRRSFGKMSASNSPLIGGAMRTALVLGVAAGLALCASSGAAQAPDGQALYRQYCRTCHGLTGTPPQQMLRIYSTLAPLDSTFLASRSQDSVVAVLRDGIGQ